MIAAPIKTADHAGLGALATTRIRPRNSAPSTPCALTRARTPDKLLAGALIPRFLPAFNRFLPRAKSGVLFGLWRSGRLSRSSHFRLILDRRVRGGRASSEPRRGRSAPAGRITQALRRARA
jgi:hypothetical protein